MKTLEKVYTLVMAGYSPREIRPMLDEAAREQEDQDYRDTEEAVRTIGPDAKVKNGRLVK